MTGQAIVAKLKDLKPIENADRIQQATIYGETVIISKDHQEGELGILFDCETQLSHEFCHYNNLYRHTHLNINPEKSGYLDDNRRIRPIRLKGVQCSGLWMPIESLTFLTPVGYMSEGTQFNEINGVEICKKYVKPAPTQGTGRAKEGKVKMADLAPTFKEHYDTDQWARNTHCVKEGDLVIITEKLHGTSGRCGYLQTLKQRNLWERIMFTLFKLLSGYGWQWKVSRQFMHYDFVVGSRRVVKSIGGKEAENKAHYYESDLWTKLASELFEGKLEKGETIYFEIVGYTPDGQPIMGTHSNSKLKPFMSKEEYKEFIKKYGEETVFSYGCTNKGVVPDRAGDHRYKIFIYRITTTNEDGETIDLSWSQVKRRSEKLGVAHVPELFKILHGNVTVENDTETHIESLVRFIEEETNGDSKEFPMHLREGVCVRVEDGSMIPRVFKHKNYYFKVLEGIIKDNDNFVDIEESN